MAVPRTVALVVAVEAVAVLGFRRSSLAEGVVGSVVPSAVVAVPWWWWSSSEVVGEAAVACIEDTERTAEGMLGPEKELCVRIPVQIRICSGALT